MGILRNIKENIAAKIAEKVTDSLEYPSRIVYPIQYPVPFEGEKTPGELGSPILYYPHYRNLRVRSWESYLSNEIPQIIVRKYLLWVIGTGLKLQAEPKKELLPEGFNVDDFKKNIEVRFRLYGNDKQGTWSKKFTLNQLAAEAKKNAIIGGDVLSVIHYEEGQIKAELIDGAHISTPFATTQEKEAVKRGNRIVHGVEINKKGEHVAYYVYERTGTFKRIQAKGKTGRTTATLIYGLHYRLNETRGIPLMTAIAETVKKLDRYKEAAVGSAEERAKIVFVQEHDLNATGANVFSKKPILNAQNTNDGKAPETVFGDGTAATIATTTNKATLNLNPGSTLKTLTSDSEINFKEFFETNADLICSTVMIPPNVAFDKYDTAYSSSQAAVKSWGHTIAVEQHNFGIDFYNPIYESWLRVNNLKGYINIPGFEQAIDNDDRCLYLAYVNARWVGPIVPQIDPLKEVKAEVEKLKEKLTTREAAAERLGEGDWRNNIEQYIDEEKLIPKEEVEPQNKKKNGEKD